MFNRFNDHAVTDEAQAAKLARGLARLSRKSVYVVAVGDEWQYTYAHVPAPARGFVVTYTTGYLFEQHEIGQAAADRVKR